MVNKTLVWEKSSSNLSCVMHVAGYLRIEIFKSQEHHEKWLWYINEFPKVGVTIEGESKTMEQAMIDAVYALKKATDALVERVNIAQQNTPGFSPPEK